MRKDDNSTSVRGDFSPPQPGPSIAAPATLPPLNPLTTLPTSHVHMPQYLSTGSSSAGAAATTATTISLRTPAGSNKDMRPSLLQESPEMAEPVSINQATAANNNENNDAMVGEAETTTTSPSTPAAAADSVMPSICCICLQSVLSGSDSVGATSCGHCYHTDCFEIKKAKLFHPLYRDMLTVREKEEGHEDDNDEYDGDDDDNNNNDEETTDTEQEEEGGHEPDDTDGEAHGPQTKCRNNDGDNIAVGGGEKRKRGEEERTGSTTDVEGDSKKHAVAEPMEDAAAAAATTTPGKKRPLPLSPDESLDVSASAPPVKLAKYKSLVRRQSETIAALKQNVARLKRGERDLQSTNDQLKTRISRKEMEIKRLVGINDAIVQRSARAELSLRSNLVQIAAIKEKMEQDLLLLQKQT
jgi:cobalamin biosynthesis protein CobT